MELSITFAVCLISCFALFKLKMSKKVCDYQSQSFFLSLVAQLRTIVTLKTKKKKRIVGMFSLIISSIQQGVFSFLCPLSCGGQSYSVFAPIGGCRYPLDYLRCLQVGSDTIVIQKNDGKLTIQLCVHVFSSNTRFEAVSSAA